MHHDLVCSIWICCRSSTFLPVSPCSLVSVLLQTTQDMTMTLSQSLSPPQVAQLFPFSPHFVHVSTQCPTTHPPVRRANCILIPSPLEWLWSILEAETFVGSCLEPVWLLWMQFYLFYVPRPSENTLQQSSNRNRQSASSGLWPGCSMSAVHAPLSEGDLWVRSSSSYISDNRPTTHTHTEPGTLRSRFVSDFPPRTWLFSLLIWQD